MERYEALAGGEIQGFADLIFGQTRIGLEAKPFDLSCPIILGGSGRVLDGGHRIAKAYLRGDVNVPAVQLETAPEPDWAAVG